jgi:hypothetical protein
MSKTPAYREETEPARTKMNFHVMIFVRREILIFVHTLTDNACAALIPIRAREFFCYAID